jgi:hypothetical protein
MSSTQQTSQSDWVEAPAIDTRVHKKSGALIRISTGKAIPTFRSKINGTVIAVLPKNEGQAGLGKGKFQQVGRVVLAVLQAGSPFKPREGFALPSDGNKWNIQPANLRWVTHKRAAYTKIMANEVVPKMDALGVLSLRDVVSRLAKEDLADYDAIGSVFGISGPTVNSIVLNKSWYFIHEFIKEVTATVSDHKFNKAKEAAMEFADYDKELATYMASYESVK